MNHSRTSLLLLALGVALAGCASKGSPAPSASSPAAASSPGAAVDACALIPAEHITKLLGVPVVGRPTSTDPSLPAGCTWVNPANYDSVSLELGKPGSAGAEAPGGTRFVGPGSVEFAAAGRTNAVQVAVASMVGKQADDAAVELAKELGPKLPS